MIFQTLKTTIHSAYTSLPDISDYLTEMLSWAAGRDSSVKAACMHLCGQHDQSSMPADAVDHWLCQLLAKAESVGAGSATDYSQHFNADTLIGKVGLPNAIALLLRCYMLAYKKGNERAYASNALSDGALKQFRHDLQALQSKHPAVFSRQIAAVISPTGKAIFDKDAVSADFSLELTASAARTRLYRNVGLAALGTLGTAAAGYYAWHNFMGDSVPPGPIDLLRQENLQKVSTAVSTITADTFTYGRKFEQIASTTVAAATAAITGMPTFYANGSASAAVQLEKPPQCLWNSSVATPPLESQTPLYANASVDAAAECVTETIATSSAAGESILQDPAAEVPSVPVQAWHIAQTVGAIFGVGSIIGLVAKLYNRVKPMNKNDGVDVASKQNAAAVVLTNDHSPSKGMGAAVSARKGVGEPAVQGLGASKGEGRDDRPRKINNLLQMSPPRDDVKNCIKAYMGDLLSIASKLSSKYHDKFDYNKLLATLPTDVNPVSLATRRDWCCRTADIIKEVCSEGKSDSNAELLKTSDVKLREASTRFINSLLTIHDRITAAESDSELDNSTYSTDSQAERVGQLARVAATIEDGLSMLMQLNDGGGFDKSLSEFENSLNEILHTMPASKAASTPVEEAATFDARLFDWFYDQTLKSAAADPELDSIWNATFMTILGDMLSNFGNDHNPSIVRLKKCYDIFQQIIVADVAAQQDSGATEQKGAVGSHSQGLAPNTSKEAVGHAVAKILAEFRSLFPMQNDMSLPPASIGINAEERKDAFVPQPDRIQPSSVEIQGGGVGTPSASGSPPATPEQKRRDSSLHLTVAATSPRRTWPGFEPGSPVNQSVFHTDGSPLVSASAFKQLSDQGAFDEIDQKRATNIVKLIKNQPSQQIVAIVNALQKAMNEIEALRRAKADLFSPKFVKTKPASSHTADAFLSPRVKATGGASTPFKRLLNQSLSSKGMPSPTYSDIVTDNFRFFALQAVRNQLSQDGAKDQGLLAIVDKSIKKIVWLKDQLEGTEEKEADRDASARGNKVIAEKLNDAIEAFIEGMCGVMEARLTPASVSGEVTAEEKGNVARTLFLPSAAADKSAAVSLSGFVAALPNK